MGGYKYDAFELAGVMIRSGETAAGIAVAEIFSLLKKPAGAPFQGENGFEKPFS